MLSIRTFLNPWSEICISSGEFPAELHKSSLNEDQRRVFGKCLHSCIFAWSAALYGYCTEKKVDLTFFGSMLNIILSGAFVTACKTSNIQPHNGYFLLCCTAEVRIHTAKCISLSSEIVLNPPARFCFAGLVSDSLCLRLICDFVYLSLLRGAAFGVYRPMDFRLEPHWWENWAYLTNLALHDGGLYCWIEDVQTVKYKGMSVLMVFSVGE